jgi:hypothetical protein
MTTRVPDARVERRGCHANRNSLKLATEGKSVRIMVLNVESTLQWSLDQSRVEMRVRAIDAATVWSVQPRQPVRTYGEWAWTP